MATMNEQAAKTRRTRVRVMSTWIAAFLICLAAPNLISADCFMTTATVKNGAVEALGESIPVFRLKGKIEVSSCEGGELTLYYKTTRKQAKALIDDLKSFYQGRTIYGQTVTGFEMDQYGQENFQACADSGEGATLSIGPDSRPNVVSVFIKKGCE